MLKNAFLLLLLAGSSLAWWDASFPYRTQVNISNSGTTLSDYQVNISLNTQALISAGKMRPDCADLRFVASNDSSQLPYWIEGACNTTATKVWVKVPSIPAGSSILYAHYGNPSAANASNGTNTFTFFDDFSGDLSKWTLTQSTAGNVQIISGETRLTGNSVWNTNGMTSNVTIGRPASIEWKSRTSTTAIQTFEGYSVQPLSYSSGLSFHRNNDGNLYRSLDGIYASWAGWSSGQTTQNIILKPTQGYTIFWNGAQKEDSASWATDGNKLVFQIFHSGVYLYIDDVKVRKYASPEPTATILTEEEALHFAYRKEALLNNTGSALADYQVNLTIDTAALVAAGKMKSDCADLRFTNSTSYNAQNWAVSYPYWIESGCNTTATKVWVKVNSIAASSSKTIYMYYGNASAAAGSNGANTFIQWHGAATATFYEPFIREPPFIFEAYVRRNNPTYGNFVAWGATSADPITSDSMWIDTNEGYGGTRFITYNDGANTGIQFSSQYLTDGAWRRIKMIHDGSGITGVIDNTYYTARKTDNIPTGNAMGLFFIANHPGDQTWSFLRKYAATEPTANISQEQQLDLTPPSVQIQSPTGQAYSTSTISVNFTATDNVGISSCTVRLNGTVNSSDCSNYTLTLANGAYNLTVTANDTTGNLNSSQVLFTIATDTTPPSVTIQSPAGIQYATGAIPVNFTATDNVGISSCKAILNGTVNSSTCDNYTLTLANGAYLLNVTANDTAGNMNSTQVSFTVAIPAGAQYNSTQATTDNNGIAAGNLSFSFTPGTLKINTGAQEQTKAIRASAGVNRIQLRAKITLGGQAATGKQVTYIISE